MSTENLNITAVTTPQENDRPALIKKIGNTTYEVSFHFSTTSKETLLYTSLIAYIYYEAPKHEQNFTTLIEFINASEVREDDEDFKNNVNLMFDRLEEKDTQHFAIRQYKKYKLAAGNVCFKGLIYHDFLMVSEVT